MIKYQNFPHPCRQVISKIIYFCRTPVLGLGLGADFTLAWDYNNNKNTNNNNNNNKNLYLNILKGTVLGNKEQGVWIRVKDQGIRDQS